MSACWLAKFSEKPCEGPEDPAHLIPKQTLKRRGIEDVWDRRLWRSSCRLHHANFDNCRLTVPRSALPAETEQAAQELGLAYWLDRRYGPIVEPAITEK